MVLFATLLASLVGAAHCQSQLDTPPTFKTHRVESWGNSGAWAEYKINLTLTKAHPWDSVSCTNACRGGVHATHEQCDLSCDKACTELHKYDFGPRFQALPGGEMDHEDERFGSSHVAQEISVASGNEIIKAIRAYHKRYDLSHWNKAPCSTSTRWQPYQRFHVTVDYQYFRNDQGPEGRQILVKGPKGVWNWGDVDLPMGELTDPKITVKCWCTYLMETGEEDAGVYLEESPKVEFASAKKLDDLGVTVACSDMNSCTVTCSNGGTPPMTICVEPGTVLECVDGSCQDLVCCELVKIHIPGLSSTTAHVRIAPEDRTAVSADGRANCINMHKPEPKKGVVYRFELPTNGSCSLLAKNTSNEMIQGPWDQMRFWIVTDRGSRDDMAKILFPKPSAGFYLKSLYEVNKITGLDLQTAEYKDCLDPGLVIGGTAPREATAWYVGLWAQNDPATLATWLSQNTKALSDECFGPNTGDVQAKHAADLFNALCLSGDPALIQAAMKCLLEAVPAEKRALVAKFHGLDYALAQLMESDEKNAGLALDVAELYRDAGTAVELANVNGSLPDGIKARAKKLSAEIGAHP